MTRIDQQYATTMQGNMAILSREQSCPVDGLYQLREYVRTRPDMKWKTETYIPTQQHFNQADEGTDMEQFHHEELSTE